MCRLCTSVHRTGRALLPGPFRGAMCKFLVLVGRATVRNWAQACTRCAGQRERERERDPDGGQVESYESGRVCESHPTQVALAHVPSPPNGPTRRQGCTSMAMGNDGRAMRRKMPSPTTIRPAPTRRPCRLTYHMHLGVHPNTTPLFVSFVSRPRPVEGEKVIERPPACSKVSHVPTTSQHYAAVLLHALRSSSLL
jgi:hypothetical protein